MRYRLEHSRAGDVSVDLRTIEGEVSEGLSELERARDAVVCDQGVLSGVPCIKGTRIPVHDIAAMLANGDSAEAILDAYPRLSETQVELAVVYARAYPWRG